jgi:hypothetical protein
MASVSGVHRRQCLQSPQKFCYICGSYVFDNQVRQINSFVKKLYFSYFQLKVGDQDKSFAPHIACKTCVEGLRYWYEGKRKAMPFAIPMQWREQKNHYGDCYFVWSTFPVIIRKTKKEWNIQIFYQLYGLFLMDLTNLYLVHLITWMANLKTVPCNRTLKKCILSHINMTDQQTSLLNPNWMIW